MKTLIAAICLPVFLVSSHAQLTRGSISGTVQDASGAVVSGVAITAVHTATNIARQTETNSAGVYRLSALEAGFYSLQLDRAGFETVKVDGVELTSTQERVLDQTLTLAGVKSSVEVSATPASADLSKASATIERSLSGAVLENLPQTALRTGFRDVQSLTLLAPAAVRAPAPGGGDSSIGGQRAGAENYMIDGVDNKELWFGGRTFAVLPEGASELRVQTNSYSAEFGRGSGAQVLVFTRGGANQVHGQVWDYYGANWMSAPSLANKRAGIGQYRSQLHTPTGSLGGPLKRDRTFFFVLLSSSRQREGPNTDGGNQVTIPTPRGWNDLSRLPLGPGQTPENRRTVLDTLAFLPDVHKLVRRYDAISFPLVNGIPIEMGATRIPIAKPADGWSGQARLDHHFTSRDTLTYRYQAAWFDAPIAVFLFTNNRLGARFSSAEHDAYDSHSLSYTRVLNSRFVNEVRFARSGVLNEANPNGPLTSQVNIGGASLLFGTQMISPYLRQAASWQWQDVVTSVKGRHTVKAGIDINRLPFLQVRHNERGQWTFDSFESFVNNRAAALTQAFSASILQTVTLQQAYFVQDDIKLRPNLVLNVGLRYQTANVPNGGYGSTDPALAAAGVLPPVQRDTNDFAPRIGLAWSPGGRTVVRGGFGISYGQTLNVQQAAANNYPNNVVIIRTARDLAGVYPVLPTLPTFPAVDPNTSFTNLSPHDKNPTTHFYSLSIQRQLGDLNLLEVGYTGNRSYHLSRNIERNPAILTEAQAAQVISRRDPNAIPPASLRRLNPAWGSRTLIDSGGSSLYNAGYVRFDRRLWHGLIAGANYTFSAALGGASMAQDGFDFRNENSRAAFDRPHRFVVFYSWQSPSARNAVLRAIAGGWQLSGFSEWQSGEPFTVTTGVDSNGDGSGGTDRPNYNPAGILRLDPVTGDWRSFSTPLDGRGVFVTPLRGNGTPLASSMPRGGNLGRNTFRGPSYSNWNVSLAKSVHITERVRFELRGDCTDVLNHRNFGPPNGNMNSPSFGVNESDPGARGMTLGAKIRF